MNQKKLNDQECEPGTVTIYNAGKMVGIKVLKQEYVPVRRVMNKLEV